jgi:hypothetical protein
LGNRFVFSYLCISKKNTKPERKKHLALSGSYTTCKMEKKVKNGKKGASCGQNGTKRFRATIGPQAALKITCPLSA